MALPELARGGTASVYASRAFQAERKADVQGPEESGSEDGES